MPRPTYHAAFLYDRDGWVPEWCYADLTEAGEYDVAAIFTVLTKHFEDYDSDDVTSTDSTIRAGWLPAGAGHDERVKGPTDDGRPRGFDDDLSRDDPDDAPLLRARDTLNDMLEDKLDEMRAAAGGEQIEGL